MLKRSLILIAVLLICISAASAVSAADNATGDTITSSDSADDVGIGPIEETIGAGETTFTALQNKINNAKENSTISLEADCSYDEGFASNGISVEKTLIIDGNGHTIDGKKSSKIFLFKASNIVVKNLRFINGGGGNGGAISCYGPIVNCRVYNCIFEDCHSEGNGGVLNRVTAVNCTFTNNGATYDGGAIDGGSAFNCRFINNSAGKRGGAVCLASDNQTVENCSFIGNSASIGGAIYISEFTKTSVQVSDCSFEKNSAGSGGAIRWCNPNGILRDSTFKSNTASDGGAIYWNGMNGMIINCDFTGNGADDSYGAVYGSSVDLESCNFTANHAKNIGAASISGTITNCNFIGNHALEKCGAIYWYSSTYNSTFINNSAADCGAIEITTSIAAYSPEYYVNRTLITGLVFINNTPNDFGGGYSVIGNTIFIKPESEYGCDLTGNITVLIAGKTFKMSLDDFLDELRLDYVTTPYINITGVATGDYEATVLYSGGDDVRVISGHKEYGPSEMHFMMHIESKMKISSSDVEKYFGGDEKFTVTLTDDSVPVSNAEVRLTVNGKVLTAKTDSKGVVSFPLDLPVGTFEATAEYDGYTTVSNVKVKSTIEVEDVTGEYLNAKVSAKFLNVKGNPLASKTVSFKVNGKTYSATTDANGAASANVELDVGNYKVTAVNSINKEEKQFNLAVSKSSSQIALSVEQKNGIVTLTAALTPPSATGNVIFNVNGENSNALISNGKATLTLKNPEAGNYTVAAAYGGDKNLNSSISNAVDFSVAKVYPVLTAKDVTKTYGTSTKFTVYLKDNKGNAMADELVNVKVNGKDTKIRTDSGGKASMAIGFNPGTYSADVTYADAQTTAKIVVKKATPKMTAKAKTFKKSVKVKKYAVTLKTNQNKVMKNAKITLKVNGKTYSAKTNSKGQATFKITNLNKKGKYTAVVKYSGNKYYNSKTVKPKITVK